MTWPFQQNPGGQIVVICRVQGSKQVCKTLFYAQKIASVFSLKKGYIHIYCLPTQIRTLTCDKQTGNQTQWLANKWWEKWFLCVTAKITSSFLREKKTGIILLPSSTSLCNERFENRLSNCVTNAGTNCLEWCLLSLKYPACLLLTEKFLAKLVFKITHLPNVIKMRNLPKVFQRTCPYFFSVFRFVHTMFLKVVFSFLNKSPLWCFVIIYKHNLNNLQNFYDLEITYLPDVPGKVQFCTGRWLSMPMPIGNTKYFTLPRYLYHCKFGNINLHTVPFQANCG